MIVLHKYSGAGNVFVLLDGRGEDVSEFRLAERITELCNRYCTDGLMILVDDDTLDFGMEFYNPDGSGGMMCGNGGRCIAAFADSLGIRPSDGRKYHFRAPDGPHGAEILSHEKGGRKIVRLRMKDVDDFHPVLKGWYVDTGTRHYVQFVPDVEAVDVDKEGRRLRWNDVFAPIGSNVNFVSRDASGVLHVRTFEKGVERETLACGTGITASAIADWLDRDCASDVERAAFITTDSALRRSVRARIDDLSVDFRPDNGRITEVFLTGPAEEIPLT